MTDVAFQPPTSASVREQSMIEYLSDHAARDGVLLEEYAQLAESAAPAYLMRLLSKDKQRVHRWCTDLASSVFSEADLLGEHPAIPRLDLGRPGSGHLADDVKFFAEVATALGDAEEILIVGPGLARTALSHFLDEHHPLDRFRGTDQLVGDGGLW